MLAMQRFAVSSACIVPAIQHIHWMLIGAPDQEGAHLSFAALSLRTVSARAFLARPHNSRCKISRRILDHYCQHGIGFTLSTN